jgi:glycerophosphoryl diester phosphodiesterase
MTKYIGHRGARGEKPENTLLGIRHALELGLDGIEIDIHLSQDGELIVIHDETLDRTTNGKGLVNKYSVEKLKTFDAGSGEKIPTLSEVIDLMKEFDKELFIEMKAPGAEEKILKLIKEKKFSDLSILKAFNHRLILNFKNLAPNIRAQVLMDSLPIDPVSIIKSAKADGISVNTKMLDKTLVDQCHQAGFFVTTWNANTKEDLLKFTEMKVDYVCTDFPKLVNP